MFGLLPWEILQCHLPYLFIKYPTGACRWEVIKPGVWGSVRHSQTILIPWVAICQNELWSRMLLIIWRKKAFLCGSRSYSSLSLKSPAGTSQKPDKSQPRCCSNLSNSLTAVGINLSVIASIPKPTWMFYSYCWEYSCVLTLLNEEPWVIKDFFWRRGSPRSGLRGGFADCV